jgi:hypothetical protein
MMVALGLVDSITAIRLWRSGVHTRGRIVGTRPVPGDLVALYARVAFTVPSGQIFEFTSGRKCKPTDEGKEVEVCYLPSKPEVAKLAENADFKGVLTQVGMVLVGILMVAGGIGALVLRVVLANWMNT